MSPANILIRWHIGLSIGLGLIPLAYAMVFANCDLLAISVFVFQLMLAVGVILSMLMLAFGKSKPWFLRVVSAIWKKYIPVQLIDYECKRRNTMAVRNPDGSLTSWVYWFNCIGNCRLLADGTVDKESETNYVYFWIPLDSSLRTEHVLKCDIPDFTDIEKESDIDKKRRIMIRLRENAG
jgi:hypothetical protein